MTVHDQAGVPLSADQAAVYDRQLRVWGVEVQNRLSAAKVLIIGGDGLAAEVAKNIVLAGVGTIAMADDTPCSQANPGNFLIHADVSPITTVAEACSRTLSAMNPFIHVTAQPLQGLSLRPAGGEGAALASASTVEQISQFISQYDLVLSTHGISHAAADALEEAAAASGKQVMIAEVRGPLAYAFVNLGPSYKYTVKSKEGDAGASKAAASTTSGGQSRTEHEIQYPRLSAALAKKVSACGGRRPVHPLYQVVRAVRSWESQAGSPPGPGDEQGLSASAAALESSEGGSEGSISRPLLQSWVLDAHNPLACAPTSAIVGGILANSVVRAISRVDLPINNWLFYSMHDNQGMVEHLVG